MTTDSREGLRKLIEDLEEQLRPLKKTLATLDKLAAARNIPLSEESRYANMRPVNVAKDILKERGEKIPEDELIKTLVDGGITLGKKRGIYNVSVGFRIAYKAGTLTVEGKNRLVGLPEWSKKK
jgi:hypothetical protein